MSVKGAGFGPVMVEGELPDKATEKKKAKKSATEKLFFFYLRGQKGSKGFAFSVSDEEDDEQ